MRTKASMARGKGVGISFREMRWTGLGVSRSEVGIGRSVLRGCRNGESQDGWEAGQVGEEAHISGEAVFGSGEAVFGSGEAGCG